MTFRSTEEATAHADDIIKKLQLKRNVLIAGAKSDTFTFDEKVKLLTWAQFQREAIEQFQSTARLRRK